MILFFYGAIHLPGATCSRRINVLIEWLMRANIVGFHHALRTNKCCEADCGGAILDGVKPGVSPSCRTHGSTPWGMPPSALQGWLSKLSLNWIIIKDTLRMCLWESPTVESIMKSRKPRVLKWLLLLDACTVLRLMYQQSSLHTWRFYGVKTHNKWWWKILTFSWRIVFPWISAVIQKLK